jgi:hypothetical protein
MASRITSGIRVYRAGVGTLKNPPRAHRTRFMEETRVEIRYKFCEVGLETQFYIRSE